MQLNQRQFHSIDVFAFTFCSTITLGIAFLPFITGDEPRNAWLQAFVASFPFLYSFGSFMILLNGIRITIFFSAIKQHLWIPLYTLVMLYFIVATLFTTIKVTDELAFLVHLYLLPNTAKWMITLVFLMVVCVAVYYGIFAITRFVVMFAIAEFLILFTVLIVALLSTHFKWMFVLPLWPVDLPTFLKTIPSEMARYAGIAPLLALIAYVKPKTKIFTPMSFGIFLVMLFYVSLSTVVIGVFGFEQAIHLASPMTALVQSISTRTGFLERMDLFFLAFWMISFIKLR